MVQCVGAQLIEVMRFILNIHCWMTNKSCYMQTIGLAADLRGIAGGGGAVLLEDSLEAGQRPCGHSRADAVILAHHNLLLLPLKQTNHAALLGGPLSHIVLLLIHPPKAHIRELFPSNENGRLTKIRQKRIKQGTSGTYKPGYPGE